MKIIVNDTAASRTGALSVLKDFYAYIRQGDKRYAEINGEKERLDWIFLLSAPYLEETDNIKVIVLSDVKMSRKARLMFDLKEGRKYIMSFKPDVYFSMQNTLPGGLDCKSVLYVHQPLCFQRMKNFSLLKEEEREYAVYQHLIGKLIYASIKRADKTIVQTEWMRQEAIRRTGVREDRVVKVTPDIDTSGLILRLKKNNGNTFFYPSGPMLYKNHECILKAVKLLRDEGITGFTVSLTITKEELKKLCPGEIPENILCEGSLEREEVLKRYQSSVLLFPSYIESFGYPPAEARAMGSVIFAADTPCMREILEGYEGAFLFDPFKPAELKELMERYLRGEIDRTLIYDNMLPVGRALGEKTESSWGLVLNELIG